MDPELIDEVESAFGEDMVVTTVKVRKLVPGVYMWTLNVHSPSNWSETAMWDRGITVTRRRAWLAGHNASDAYAEAVGRQVSWSDSQTIIDETGDWD